MKTLRSICLSCMLLAAPFIVPAAVTWTTSSNNLVATAGATQMEGTTICTGGNLGTSQYIYLIGGNTTAGPGDSAKIHYAQITGVGTTGVWQTATLTLPLGTSGPDWAYIERNVVSYNGYIYIVGGDTNGSDPTRNSITVLQPTATGDITAVFGSTTAASGFYDRFESSAVVNPATGKLYIIGGAFSATTAATVVQLNNDGTIGVPAATTAMGTATGWGPVAIVGTDIYMIGGVLTTGPTVTTPIVQHAVINGDGTLGAWSNTTAPLPEGLFDGGCAVYNGNLYVTQGCVSGNTDVRDNVYRAVFSGSDITSWVLDSHVPVPGRRVGATASSNGIFIVGSRQDASVISSDVYIGTVVLGADSWSMYN